jgi:hypothetical protein
MSDPTPGPAGRNRIVISLEDSQQPSPRPQQVQPLASPNAPRGYVAPTPAPAKSRSRVKKALAVLLVLILLGGVALGAGGFLYWRSFQSTPVYSLALLADAAQRGDTATFNELVDTDKISDNFVPQVTEKLNAKFGGLIPPVIKAVADKLIPQFLPGVKTQVREQLNQKVKDAGADSKDYPFALLALGLKWKTTVTEKGDTATAILTVKDQPLELTLQRAADDRWKIVGAKDDALADKIAEQVFKKLPALAKDKDGGGLLDEVEKRLPGLNDLRDQLPDAVRDQLPDTNRMKKDAEEKIKRELEERLRKQLPPELRDKLPLGNSNAPPPPKPPPPAKPKPPKPEPRVEP